MGNIEIGRLSAAIERELTIYSKSVTDTIKAEAKSHMSDLVKRTKQTAPVGRRQKHYKDNISSKKLSETDRCASYLWYVKGSDYRLSHLLEHGHALRGGGRTEGTGFISAAADPIIEDYLAKVEEAIRNG